MKKFQFTLTTFGVWLLGTLLLFNYGSLAESYAPTDRFLSLTLSAAARLPPHIHAAVAAFAKAHPADFLSLLIIVIWSFLLAIVVLCVIFARRRAKKNIQQKPASRKLSALDAEIATYLKFLNGGKQ